MASPGGNVSTAAEGLDGPLPEQHVSSGQEATSGASSAIVKFQIRPEVQCEKTLICRAAAELRWEQSSREHTTFTKECR